MYEGPNPFIDWNGPFTICWKGMKGQLKQVTTDKRMDLCSNLAWGAGLFFFILVDLVWTNTFLLEIVWSESSLSHVKHHNFNIVCILEIKAIKFSAATKSL